MLLEGSWSGHVMVTRNGQECQNKRKPHPFPGNTDPRMMKVHGLEVMEQAPHCTVEKTGSETMYDMPENTPRVCDSIWTKGRIFPFLLGVARLFSQVLICV